MSRPERPTEPPGAAGDLAERRAERWWLSRSKVRTIVRAASFIDDVGFALLFPRSGIALPSLWSIGSDAGGFDEIVEGWGTDEMRLWGWKDELPRRGLAWYGVFVRGRQSFLSPAVLADLYPRSGTPDDFLRAPMSAEARRIAQVLLASGPQSKAVLREATGMVGKRFSADFARALAELGRALVVTHFGTEDEGAGWPSAVIELTARAFRVRPSGTEEERRARAAARFLDTMIACKPAELARAFGWTAPLARAELDAAVERGVAVRAGSLYSFTKRGTPRRRSSSSARTPRRSARSGPTSAKDGSP